LSINQLGDLLVIPITCQNCGSKNLEGLQVSFIWFEENIFDNAVIVIDEAHNFISRIVNKIGKEKEVGILPAHA
jgi:hypothetical protein